MECPKQILLPENKKFFSSKDVCYCILGMCDSWSFSVLWSCWYQLNEAVQMVPCPGECLYCAAAVDCEFGNL